MYTTKGRNVSRIRARKLGYYIWNRLCGGVGMVNERGVDFGTGPRGEAASRAEGLGMGRNIKGHHQPRVNNILFFFHIRNGRE